MVRRRSVIAAAAGGSIGAMLPPRLHAAAAQAGQTIKWPPLRLLDGSVLPPAAWQGTAAIVVVWATWCAYCRRHNAHVDKLHRSIAERPLRVVTIVIDADEALVGRAVAQRGYSFPVTLDVEPLRSRLTARRSVPMTFVIDTRARLLQSIPGEMTEADVLELPTLALRGAR